MAIGIAQAAVLSPPTVTPQIIAEHVLWLRRDMPTTPRCLVKMVYLCHGWVLGFTGLPLISEPVVAGQFGPIVKSLDDRYAIYGNGPIFGEPERNHSGELGSEVSEIIAAVHARYGEVSDDELSEITHLEDAPWSTVKVGEEIADTTIQEYYKTAISEATTKLQQGPRA